MRPKAIKYVLGAPCRPDYFLPWQNHPKRESTGTGFVIRDRLILTNAHVVADQTYVTVKRHGSGTKYRAGKGWAGEATAGHAAGQIAGQNTCVLQRQLA